MNPLHRLLRPGVRLMRSLRIPTELGPMGPMGPMGLVGLVALVGPMPLVPLRALLVPAWG